MARLRFPIPTPANRLTRVKMKIFPQSAIYFFFESGNKADAIRVSRCRTMKSKVGMHLDDGDKTKQFEAIALPHLDAAYNLARWLTRNDQNAEDVVQMAYLRAFKFFAGFRGGDARAWILTIVRHTYYTSLRDHRHLQCDVSFDEELHYQDGSEPDVSSYGIGIDPENMSLAQDAKRVVNQALEQLPAAFREIVVLKEIDDLSYKEIAEIAGIPLGTVMSRLARGRKLLGQFLKKQVIGE